MAGRMGTEPAIILAQWLSPAYPVGGFAHSHGLEELVGSGKVRDARSLRDWLETVLDAGSGRSGAVFLAAAYRAGPDGAAELDSRARAFSPSFELLAESDRQGTAFSRTTEAVWGKPLGCRAYPVAVGLAARLNGLPLRLTAEMFLHAFLSNLVSAALRLLPIGQTGGQHLISALTPLCVRIAQESLDGDLDSLSSTAFLSDIATMRHETRATRIFRS